jgi:hypothetical protein
MITNRLAKQTDGVRLQLTAADFASIARENGDGKKAQAWQRVADERGEERVPDHLRVSFTEAKEKIYVPVRRW